MSPIARTVSLCGVFIVLVLGLLLHSKLRTPTLSADQLREQGVFLLPRPRDIAPFSLTDDLGNTFDNKNLKGRWTFVFFGFTQCPDICPVTLSEMAKAYASIEDEKLKQDFQGVLVTVDPERDTQAILNAYVAAFSQDFVGVLGERDPLATFASQVNAAFAKMPAQDQEYTMDHTGNLIIINPMGHYHGFIKLPHNAQTIRMTYQTLAAQF